jgi:t-SNARE complex subunit (syntaxin)
MSTSSFDFIIENNTSNTIYGKNGEKITMKEVSVHEEKDQLQGISHSLTGLTTLLSEMSEKVLSQGEMVDRIDVNTKVAYDFTKKSNDVLRETKDILENGCAAKLQKWLMIFNLFLFVSIIIKFNYL